MIFPNVPLEKLCEATRLDDSKARVALAFHEGRLMLFATSNRHGARIPVRDVTDEELKAFRATFVKDPEEAGYALMIQAKTYGLLRRSGPVKIVVRETAKAREWFADTVDDVSYKLELVSMPRLIEGLNFVIAEAAKLKPLANLFFNYDLMMEVAEAADAVTEVGCVPMTIPVVTDGTYTIHGKDGAVGVFATGVNPDKNPIPWLQPTLEAARQVMLTAFVQTEQALALARGLLEAFGENVPQPVPHDAERSQQT